MNIYTLCYLCYLIEQEECFNLNIQGEYLGNLIIQGQCYLIIQGEYLGNLIIQGEVSFWNTVLLWIDNVKEVAHIVQTKFFLRSLIQMILVRQFHCPNPPN
jgi:hypothetical protein